jgi:hypothetical protein
VQKSRGVLCNPFARAALTIIRRFSGLFFTARLGTDFKARRLLRGLVQLRFRAIQAIRNIIVVLMIASAAAATTACGHDTTQRAATGAIAGGVVAGPVGAAVGAGAGAAVSKAQGEK